MKSENPAGYDGSGKPKRGRAGKPRTDRECTLIHAERSGDWMPVEDLWEAAKSGLGEGKDITLNLDKINHLDASALQILLALDAEQKRCGRHLELVNTSSNLRHWFEYSGAAAHFPMTEQRSNE